MDETTSLSRRDVLRLGAVVGGALVAGALVGCSNDDGKDASPKTKQADPQSKSSESLAVRLKDSAPPLVDRVAIWSLVDNSHDIFLKSATIGEPTVKCEIQRNGLGFGSGCRRSSSRASSAWASTWSSTQGGKTRNYLLDYGLSKAAGLDNMAFLKIDPSNVDALILSHGHYDHFGGLVPLLTEHR